MNLLNIFDKIELLFDIGINTECLFQEYNRRNCNTAFFRITPEGIVMLNPRDNYSKECMELDKVVLQKIDALCEIYSDIHAIELTEKKKIRAKVSRAYAVCPKDEQKVRLLRILR